MLKNQKVVIFISRKISNKQKFNKCSTYKTDPFSLFKAVPLLNQTNELFGSISVAFS
jgi:hypothetical protein